jgi:hypothetical protein
MPQFTDEDTLPTKPTRDGTGTEWCDSDTGKPLAIEYDDCWSIHSRVLHCLGKKHIHTFSKEEFAQLVASGGGSLRGAIDYRARHTTCRVVGVVRNRT